MSILGNQTCAVCGKQITPPHSRYRIENDEVICNSCYKEAQIQPGQMHFGKIKMTSGQIKKQIRDIDKQAKLVERKASSIEIQLSATGVSAAAVSKVSKEQLAAVGLSIRGSERIITALFGTFEGSECLLMATHKKIMLLSEETLTTYDLPSVSKLVVHDAVVDFKFNAIPVTVHGDDTALAQKFVATVQEELVKYQV